ncbi:Protein of unknown function [Gryllus bimaculatus]|nr:Protein of unknown function [Gryllus bimaculatus]
MEWKSQLRCSSGAACSTPGPAASTACGVHGAPSRGSRQGRARLATKRWHGAPSSPFSLSRFFGNFHLYAECDNCKMRRNDWWRSIYVRDIFQNFH